MTFPQWRPQSRLYDAPRTPADDGPVATGAHRCGRSSASAVVDVFRRSFGCSPGSHRRRTR